MKTYIIVLKESEQSCYFGNQANEAANNFGLNSEIFPGTLGYHAKEKFDYYGINNFLTHSIINKPGQQGCFLSHFELWIKCIEINEPIMVLEHDGIVIRSLPDNVLDNFTEVLKLDAFEYWKPSYLTDLENSLSKEVGYHKFYHGKHHVTGNYSIGAYGYIIKPKAAEKLVSFSKETGIVCTELQLGTKIVDITTVTSSIVKLHEYYHKDTTLKSSTNNLSIVMDGVNSLKTC